MDVSYHVFGFGLCFVVHFPISPQQSVCFFCFQRLCTSDGIRVFLFCSIYSLNALIQNRRCVAAKNKTRAFSGITCEKRTPGSRAHMLSLSMHRTCCRSLSSALFVLSTLSSSGFLFNFPTFIFFSSSFIFLSSRLCFFIFLVKFRSTDNNCRISKSL